MTDGRDDFERYFLGYHVINGPFHCPGLVY